MKYKLCIDDNFHYMDESERTFIGEFETEEEAVAEAKKIVDNSLRHEYGQKPDITPEQLYDRYMDFGDDPFIVSESADKSCDFSAWNYAKSRCADICSEFSENKKD